MTDDQHRIGALTEPAGTLAAAFERWDNTPADERPAPLTLARHLLDRLQTEHGWRPPVTAEPVPPLRPDRTAGDSAREAAMAQIRADLAAIRARPKPVA